MKNQETEDTPLSRAQAEMLVSPIRSELLMALITLDRASVNELAEHLGRSAKALYHHLRPMIEVGLVVEVDTRRSGARTESIYAPVAAGVRLPKTLLPKGVEHGLKLAIREAKSHPPDSTQYIRIGGRMSGEDLETLQSKLRELAAWTQTRNNSKGMRFACSAVLTLLDPRS